MKRILTGLCLLIVLYSCKNATADSPRNTVAGFIDASRAGNIAEVKKYITRSDVGLLEMGETYFAKIDPKGSKNWMEKLSKDFQDKTKDAGIEIKDEKIEGDKATVDVVFSHNGKAETRPFSLLKEEGAWKISLLSTGMKNSGSNQKDVEQAMKSVNLDSLQGALKEGMRDFNKMNKDSLRRLIEEGMKNVE